MTHKALILIKEALAIAALLAANAMLIAYLDAFTRV